MGEVRVYNTNEIDALILGDDSIETYVYRGICKQADTITFVYIYGENMGCFAIYGAKMGLFATESTKQPFVCEHRPIVHDRTADMKLLITIMEELTTSLTGCELFFKPEVSPAPLSVDIINNLLVKTDYGNYAVSDNIKDITMPLRCLTATILRLYNSMNEISKKKIKLAKSREEILTRENADLKQQLVEYRLQ